jgi:hypothetical protein
MTSETPFEESQHRQQVVGRIEFAPVEKFKVIVEREKKHMDDHYSTQAKTVYAIEEVAALYGFVEQFKQVHGDIDGELLVCAREAFETCWRLLKYVPMLYLNKYPDGALRKEADRLLKHEMCRENKVHK